MEEVRLTRQARRQNFDRFFQIGIAISSRCQTTMAFITAAATSDTAVAVAAPTSPNAGTRAKFSAMFKTAAAHKTVAQRASLP